jgi:charged multivesicular body protein 7
LKEVLSDARLQPENVDNIMDQLSEVLANHADIDQAIMIGTRLSREAAEAGVDEDEIDAELNALISDDRTQELKALPAPPKGEVQQPVYNPISADKRTQERRADIAMVT